MTIKRVIIHLGMAKAGSSSIQHTLYNNTGILEKNGFRYLTEWGVNHLYILHKLLSPNPVMPIGTGNFGKSPFNVKQKNKKAVNTMLRVMNTTACETLILSGEYFAELYHDTTIENIKKFIGKYFKSEGIETTIVYFVRNPLTWLISSLQQQIFTKGFMSKNGDFFEIRMKQYEGVVNLKKHFSDSLLLFKFEDACLDKDGLSGCFLKAIGFPEDNLNNIKEIRKNESRSMEAMEFINYIEAVEPRYPYMHYRRENPNRSLKDIKSLLDIKGAKFDLPYQSKVEFWSRFSGTIKLLMESTGIDYTDYKISPPLFSPETYAEESIQSFIDAFPKLNFALQKHFIRFFEKKYMETAQEKFKQLHFKDSIPYTIYNNKNAFFSLLILSIKNRVFALIPHRLKKTMKWI